MTKTKLTELENLRRALQTSLDAEKSQKARNELGQFSTPYPLAIEVVEEAIRYGKGPIRFLDPALGTAVFFSALHAEKGRRKITTAVGYDIDAHYAKPSTALWKPEGLDYRTGDFTTATPTAQFNLLVCNPPYVRHHHLEGDAKIRLGERAHRDAGMSLSGLSGLYCYFMAFAHRWMAPGAISVWLIPSEFMDVNYGQAVRDYLRTKVTLLRIHRFDPNEVQFGDALVSSAVVWFRHETPTADHATRFTFGGSIATPHIDREVPLTTLAAEHKWTRFPVQEARNNEHGLPTLGDFFKVKRGLATGANEVFILNAEQIAEHGIPRQFVRPILPSPRYLPGDVIESAPNGNPIIDQQLFLLDCRLTSAEVENRFPRLWQYLQSKKEALGDAYLLKQRKVWFHQEDRPAAPIVCTYMGRSDGNTANPFRFILNRSKATAANAYHMLYPVGSWVTALEQNPALINQVWTILQNLNANALREEGRVYGGGLHKVEPKELGKVQVPELAALLNALPGQGQLAL